MPAIALETAKSFLGVTGDADDAQIQLLIDAAIGEIEATTGTRLITTNVEVTARTFGELTHLPVGPVSEVVSLVCRACGSAVVIPPERLVLTGSGLERGIAVADAPIATDIVATVKAGYGADEADMPAPLRWAVLALVRGKFDDREVDVEPLLANYRIFG